ncbi:MOSC domain-containing protein [Thalassospira marina]|uniref:MOSC domain-containing protein n=1 Tax=Thalassospira marina TaxID=2048283 RepID=A0A2N3KRA1_9PROT|nr:MOSC domain-containing protein [Thalassospira marina]PKR53082.1 MOSC domain-containing protein [Thalassospira marina]
MANGELGAIMRYPVKGLRGVEMDAATIDASAMIKDDRRYVLASSASVGQGGLDGWARKSNFLQLVNTPKLAELGIEYNDETTTLAILRNGRTICKGNLEDAMGRTVIEDFLTAFLKNDIAGSPKIMSVPGTHFGDMEQPYIALLNRESIRDFGDRIASQHVDPMRFRGNFLVDGLPAWSELEWAEDQKITIGDVSFRMIHPITRCKATTINPDTAQSDINVPLLLRKGMNHLFMGVYLEATSAGTIKPGDSVTVG